MAAARAGRRGAPAGGRRGRTSLVDDDVLRREDGQRAITPYLALFALLAGTHSRSGDGLPAAYLGYAVGSGVILAVAAVLASHTRTGAAGAAAAVRP